MLMNSEGRTLHRGHQAPRHPLFETLGDYLELKGVGGSTPLGVDMGIGMGVGMKTVK